MIFIKTLLKIKSKFDTSSYELDRVLPNGEKNNWIKGSVRPKKHEQVSWVTRKRYN